jgi:RNA polymerase subunit RPABC4/transcription elongation factor Spt4
MHPEGIIAFSFILFIRIGFLGVCRDKDLKMIADYGFGLLVGITLGWSFDSGLVGLIGTLFFVLSSKTDHVTCTACGKSSLLGRKSIFGESKLLPSKLDVCPHCDASLQDQAERLEAGLPEPPEETKPLECFECGTLIPGGTAKCPQCGWTFD